MSAGRPIGVLVLPGRIAEELNAHMAEHRLPCVDDEPTFFRYRDGCTVTQLADGSLYFVPTTDLIREDTLEDVDPTAEWNTGSSW